MRKKSRSLIITIIVLVIAVVGLAGLLVVKWIKPVLQQNELKSEIKNVSTEKVNELIEAEKTAEAEEETEANEASELVMPTVSNDTINGTTWVNYDDNSIIVFDDGYFVWYADKSMSSDNYTLGKFEFYVGKEAFNIVTGLFDEEFEQTDVDSVLIMEIVSKKVDGEETTETSDYKYLFGYYTEDVMSYIDLKSYDEYTFLRVNTDGTVETSEGEASSEETAEPEASADGEANAE